MVRQPGIEKMVVSSSPQTDVIGYVRLKFLGWDLLTREATKT
jgi:hypothetical protein